MSPLHLQPSPASQDELEPVDRLIVALDAPSAGEARELAAKLDGVVHWLKVGMTLFFAEGPNLIRSMQGRGFSVFCDLKAHDIPHQVAGAISSLAALGVELVTVHSAGGPEMLAAAREASEGTPTRVLGVTVLTSMDRASLAATGVGCDDVTSLVLQRARLVLEAGLDGVVASPLEAAAIAAIAPAGFEIVTPGIRPLGASRGDQRRVATPSSALAAGATRLVVGRPITQDVDPAAAAARILQSMRL